MNWTIFYAVAIGLLTVLGAGLAGHLAAKESWHKWFFWGSGLLIVALIYLQARSYKEPPTAEEIASAVLKKQQQTHNVDTQAGTSPSSSGDGMSQHKTKIPKKSVPPPTQTGQTPPSNTQSLQAHLSVSQSQKISSRPDAPIATEVVIQTDKVFPSLRLVMQCDKPLVDTEYALGGTSGMAQMMVSSGLAKGHPNVVVYSYGSSTPPFGPANPLIIEVWSKEPVTCNQVATF